MRACSCTMHLVGLTCDHVGVQWLPLGKDRWGNETGVDQIFVEHPCFKRPGMYGEWGKDYDDNLMRFGLFSWAAIEAPLCLPTLAPFG